VQRGHQERKKGNGRKETRHARGKERKRERLGFKGASPPTRPSHAAPGAASKGATCPKPCKATME